MLHGQPTIQHLIFRILPCYVESLHFTIYYSDLSHATWKAYISTFNFDITAILYEQPSFQHLLFRFSMDSLHFNIYSSDSLHATWTAYFSTFTLQIPSMLNGQPTFQH